MYLAQVFGYVFAAVLGLVAAAAHEEGVEHAGEDEGEDLGNDVGRDGDRDPVKGRDASVGDHSAMGPSARGKGWQCDRAAGWGPMARTLAKWSLGTLGGLT